MARTYRLKSNRPSRLGIDYAAALNQEQRDVVTAPSGPTLVLAGAGSGKTRALTYRVARFLDQGVSPASIYLVTFTNRAAREMLERVEELVGPMARQVVGGTFHSVANQILRRHAEAVGYRENFSILDGPDAREVMAAAIVDANISVNKSRFPKPEVVLDLASAAINTQTPVREVVADRHPRFFHIADEIASACRAYIERKAEMNLMDFDDLLMNWKVLLEEVAPVATQLQTGCKAILVDEYQDTNALQGDIVDLMAKVNKNVTVVGDDAQCIYGFRGAEVENMLGFSDRYPGARVVKLELNYRSTPEVISLANATLRRMDRHLDKTLRPVRPPGPLPALVPCRDVFMQAEFITQRILEMRDEGVSLDEIAVLYRAHSHAMEIQVELTRRGIPFMVRSGLRFFEQAHIKDVLAYLKFIHNPDDELSFRRAVKLHDGVGNATSDELWHALQDALRAGEGELDADTLLPLVQQSGKRAKRGVDVFVRVLAALTKRALKKSPGEMVQLILARPPEGGGYGDALDKAYANAGERKDDIEQLADYAAGFDDLDAFLTELSLVQSFSVEDAVSADEPDEKVTLSSVHQAKGLEWGRVFIPWLVDGRLPSDLALREEGGEDEERRLFYVAMTRAKEELTITYPQIHKSRDYAQVLLRRSRFIEELPVPELRSADMGPDEPLAGLYEVWQIEELPSDLVNDDEMTAKIEGNGHPDAIDGEVVDASLIDAVAAAKPVGAGEELPDGTSDALQGDIVGGVVDDTGGPAGESSV